MSAHPTHLHRCRMYAFDVHCNAFFPAFLLLGPLQLALSPLLLSAALVPRALSAGAWGVAVEGCGAGSVVPAPHPSLCRRD